MAGKQGRPRRKPQNAETNEVGQDQKTEEKANLAEKVEAKLKKEAEEKKIADEKDEKESQQLKEAEENELKAKLEAEQAAKSKVIEFTTKTKANPPKIRPSERNRGLHTVIVRGKARKMTKQSYDALKKDPKLKVILPKGSLLVEPNIDKPCKDC